MTDEITQEAVTAGAAPVEAQQDQSITEEVQNDKGLPQSTDEGAAVEESEAVQEEVEQTEDETAEPGEEEKPKGETVPKDRFRKVWYKAKQQERELNELRAKTQQAEAPEIPPTSPKPTLDQFDYDNERYQEALVDWKLDQRDARLKHQEAIENQQKVISNFRQQQDTYIEQNPEYRGLAQQAEAAGIQFSDAIAQSIFTSDAGVKVHHHLLANPQKLEQLMTLDPLAQMREMVKLEGKFAAKKPAVKKAATTINPVTTSSSTSERGTDALAKMNAKDYYEYRMAQRAKK